MEDQFVLGCHRSACDEQEFAIVFTHDITVLFNQIMGFQYQVRMFINIFYGKVFPGQLVDKGRQCCYTQEIQECQENIFTVNEKHNPMT